MNWNLEVGPFVIRLPVMDQDGDALYGLLKDPEVSAHIPKPPGLDEVSGPGGRLLAGGVPQR